jgi:hypothetical protein
MNRHRVAVPLRDSPGSNAHPAMTELALIGRPKRARARRLSGLPLGVG